MATSPHIATVSRRAAERIVAGHPWVYKSDLKIAKSVPPGALVEVHDERGRTLGSALYSSSSQIALRLLQRKSVKEAELLNLIRERLRAAFAYRKEVVKDSNACRLVFSEADGLPGLIIDRFSDLAAVQVLTQAMDREDIREVVTSELSKEVANLFERVEPRIRELEQLPERASGPVAGEKSATTFTMNGVQFLYDSVGGQKSGAFLDQRENYAAAVRYARGEALDVCTYQGGFALHLAKSKAITSVVAVDSSRPALGVADKNGELNKSTLRCEVEWIEANAFDLLKDYATSGKQYDTIVLDPPAFAKSKANLATAIQGYKEMNLRALKMLRPGGTLVTCSCSYHVSDADFMEMLASAAADAHRTLRILETRGAALDHPRIATIPETHYLKCVIATAD